MFHAIKGQGGRQMRRFRILSRLKSRFNPPTGDLNPTTDLRAHSSGQDVLPFGEESFDQNDPRLSGWLRTLSDSRLPGLSDPRPHHRRTGSHSVVARRGTPVTGLLQRYTIRGKLLFGIVMLVVTIITLTLVGLAGFYRYQALADAISTRATELPLATDLSQWAAKARDSNARICQMKSREGMIDSSVLATSDQQLERLHFDQAMLELNLIWSRYGDAIGLTCSICEGPVSQHAQTIQSDELAAMLIDIDDQRNSLMTIGQTIHELDRRRQDPRAQAVYQQTGGNELAAMLDHLVEQCNEHLDLIHGQMAQSSDHVRSQHRFGTACAWIAFLVASLVTFVMVIYFQMMVIGPFSNLVSSARMVACGEYENTIDLGSDDEIGELAAILNQMTDRFRRSLAHIQDLVQQQDEEIKIRSREVIRNEQLASVGFLAAGFAHEINNPMAAIAWSAEALESRVSELQMLAPENRLINDEMMESLQESLQRIEGEAYRCKSITERMLSFSRVGQVERQMIDVVPLVKDVVDLIGTLGKYKCQNVSVTGQQELIAYANSQEIRQVVLNLLTNAMESVDEDGLVVVELNGENDFASVRVRDTGCGMSNEVMQHLFEPFYTRRRDGSGTGLGLSISYRIVCQHGGQLIPHSEGLGMGSEMELRLPNGPVEPPAGHQPSRSATKTPWRETSRATSTPQAA